MATKSLTKKETQLEVEIKSLEEQAEAELPEDLFVALRKISFQLSKNGMRLEEACLLANYDYNRFQDYLDSNPLVSRIIDVKELQYKRDLMETLSDKARSGDDKLAQWLLERRYPEEFGSKKKAPDSDDGNILVQAIEYIQRRGDNDPLVSETSARAIVIKKDGSGEVIKKLEDVLN